MSMRTNILIGLGVVAVIGLGTIVYKGRPVQQLAKEQANESVEMTLAPEADPAPVTADNSTGIVAGAEIDKEDGEENEVEDDAQSPTAVTQSATTKSEPIKASAKDNQFTLATVATHNKETDCWSAINGSVYDLSSWVSRHPGGIKPIVNLCGKDGSASFTKKHGGSSKAQAALILLKIGSLK